MVTTIRNTICNHLSISTFLSLAYAGSTSLSHLKPHHLFSVPEGNSSQADRLTDTVVIISEFKRLSVLCRRVPQIFHKLHTTAAFRIHVNRTTVIEIYPEGHICILNSRAMMPDLAVIISGFCDNLRHLQRITSPEKAGRSSFSLHLLS